MADEHLDPNRLPIVGSHAGPLSNPGASQGLSARGEGLGVIGTEAVPISPPSLEPTGRLAHPEGPSASGDSIGDRAFGEGPEGFSEQARGVVDAPITTGGVGRAGESIFIPGTASVGGVFENAFPIGGPVAQIFRGGSAPIPNVLYLATLSSAGPIGTFFLGLAGAPIGEETLGGGGLPIGLTPAEAEAIASIQPRTAEVGGPLGFGSPITSAVPPIGEQAR